MNNQPNEMATLEWLLPLFHQELSLLSRGWQDDRARQTVSSGYHQISGALVMANLPDLAALAAMLSAVAQRDLQQPLRDYAKKQAQVAHQLLSYELSQFAQRGSYRKVLINAVKTMLAPLAADEAKPDEWSKIATDNIPNQDIVIFVPETKALAFSIEQYQKLLSVWRQQLQKLLAENRNSASTLAPLTKVAHYLWHGAPDWHQPLWYLVDIWLQNLADNQSPLPEDFAQVLALLERVIDGYSNSQNNLDSAALQKIISQVYIQLAMLNNIDSAAKQILVHLPKEFETTQEFLPRILGKIEAVIFGLDDPSAQIVPMQQIVRQLKMRGWLLYETQAAHILAELESAFDQQSASNAAFDDIKWQIERQLQELYSAIYHTEQAIKNKIGTPITFTASSDLAELDDSAANPAQLVADDALRQLRIAVEDVKNDFNNYVQRQQSHLLSPLDAFFDIGDAFEDMGLAAIRPLTDKLGALMAQLSEKEVKSPNWPLIQALADSLSAIELLLDYLAQQVFDQSLLAKAFEQIDHAERLFDDWERYPDATFDYKPVSQDLAVVRYDDAGEVLPEVTDEAASKADATEDNSEVTDAAKDAENQEHNRSNEVSPELKAAQDALAADDFGMDEEIREIFIEEADEVLADLNELVPVWAEDAQDFAPLTDIRRGFHTLKGSGRMVGAFSVGEAAWAIENLLNRVLDNTLPVSKDVVSLVTESLAMLPILVTDFTAKQAPSIDPARLILQSQNLLAGRELMAGLDTVEEKIAADFVLDNELIAQTDTLPKAVSLEMPSVSGTTATLPQVISTLLQEVDIPADSDDADPDIKEIFIEEAEEVLAEITPLYEQWQQQIDDLTHLTDIRRGFHTLKGSGRMVGACYSAELAWAVENMLNRLLDHTVSVSKDIVNLVGDVINAYPEYIRVFAENLPESAYPSQTPIWIACATAFSKQLGDEFSYQDLIGQKEAVSEENIQDPVSLDDQVTDQGSSHALFESDHILKACQSAQEIIHEALIEMPSQSEEEAEFAAIFVEEAYELLDKINDFVAQNQGADNIEVSDDIVRAFHTLRAASGSSALAAISEVSRAIEQSLEQLQQQDALMNAKHLEAIAQSTSLIDRYLDAYQQDQSPQEPSEISLQSPEDLAALQNMLEYSEAANLIKDSPFSVAELLKIGIDALLDAECYLRHSLSDHNTDQIRYYISQQQKQIARLSDATKSSPKFNRILSALAHAYEYLHEHVEAARREDIQSLLLAGHDQVVGLFDALAGSMSLKVDDQVVNELQALGENEVQDVPQDAQDRAVAKTPVEEPPQAAAELQIETESVTTKQAEALELEVIDTDIELLDIFLEEAQELDNAIAQTFSKWRADKDNIATLKILQRHLHTIKGGARMAGIHSIGDLTHEAESVYEAFVEDRLKPTPQWLDIMQTVQDTLSLQIDYVIRYRESFFAKELIAQLQDFIRLPELPTAVTLILPALQNHLQEEEVEEETAQSQDNHAVNLEAMIAKSWQEGLPDPDILEVFLEEADELIVSSNKYLQLFLNNISDIVALQALQRDLHTIKGGARMVGANGVADLAHQMETVYEELAIRRRPATKMVAQLLEACHDWLADAIFILKHQLNPPMPKALIEALVQFSKNPDSLKQVPHQSLQNELSAVLAAKSKQEAIRGVEDITQMPPMMGSFVEQEQSSTNEMIRISSGLIERMINLSGESAINRARIDMGMSSLTNSIEEMGVTIQRLADQLRRMEIELEAQILSQIDDTDLIDTEGFDPLEMDQYSSLNQLSKSLSESASDLVDINSTLLEKTRDSENLLLQLSRTQTELQDGLMNSRMVPFSRLTPRLERIVRQTANELNKSVELTIINADDEMDRTILERITSPLEHMLRNAVDHGIESPQARLNAGKERSGQITIEVIREGSEVVIHLTDDGRGINVDAVRNKAIAQGLIDANDKSLSDIDVMQYIFNAGLTTTKQVTQISGRGVGMDVVISEIKQLGGLVSVTSKANQGSRFTIRVPLTVAVSDALVVRAADRYYAIPLVQIERVVRVQPEKLFEYYQSNRTTLRIDDDDYRVHYLNEILTGSSLNELIVNTNSSLPVIIVKNRAGQNLALQVDQIAGSRIEVVVKPLGRQLSHLPGISAATIMGDGSVMLILDMLALLRNAAMLKDIQQSSTTISPKETKSEQPTIMVVDDSVTVRKVTSRFLERQGLTAVVAKDGVDAIEILQELTPDLILLDIEMPRMDGFEVATQIRHNRRLEQIPIIMITSRTGEKHRERAFEIGVNGYMGKPFQENELLDNIQSLLGITLGAVHDG